MNTQNIIDQTAEFVKEKLHNQESGHDWWHVYRVWQNAKQIGVKENADMYVVELAALLHDIADYKFHDGDLTVGPRVAREWLEKLNIEEGVIQHIADIIENLSYKGADVENKISTKEGMVVQDADRLDAIGAMGIARCFSYSGFKGNPLHDPEVEPKMHTSFEEYKKNVSPAINHFYEKLLLLKDRMNTVTAKKMAEERHNYMQGYLDQFLAEWDGKK